MKIAYLDCLSGISGDMMLGALIDAGVPLEKIAAGIDSLGLPSCKLVTHTVKRKGFRATHLVVEHEPEHKHRHLHHITKMIDASQLTPNQQTLAKRIFTRLGEVEAYVHNSTIEKVHFHEVGAVDSIADICGAAIGWDLLGVDQIVCSPVPTGTGFVHMAHGRCSVPAPATAELLKGIPLAASTVEFELTTPTGAAIVSTLAQSFGPLPAMKIERIGYGAGTKELTEQPNMLRLLVGTTTDVLQEETIAVLETTLDDTTGEVIGHTLGLLFEAGALDAFTTAVQMKKQRPGVNLTVLCQPDAVARMEGILFRETNTLGVRRWTAARHILPRAVQTVQTQWGPIVGKVAQAPGEPPRFSPEYDACRQIAALYQQPLRVVYEAAEAAYRAAH